jgi:hypothetical protein
MADLTGVLFLVQIMENIYLSIDDYNSQCSNKCYETFVDALIVKFNRQGG